MLQHSNTYIINNMGKKILIYILVIAVAVTSIGLVWYYFKNQVLLGLGWFAIFALVFLSGWLLGRFGGRKAKKQIAEVSESNE